MGAGKLRPRDKPPSKTGSKGTHQGEVVGEKQAIAQKSLKNQQDI
jgi:hypothetical protein